MKKIFILLFISINAAAYLFWLSPYSITKEPIRIAVVGPMGAARGDAMRKGIELYEDRINKLGGVDGRKVKLLFYDDKNDPEVAEKIALEIAYKNKALLVIGHYYSSTSTAAGKIYKRNAIPAITASATAESVILDNEWYFRVIPGNDLEARFAANYISKGMKKQSVSIIFTKDDYGISLADNFEKTVKALGMKMVGKQEWDNDKSSDNQSARITKELIASGDPGVIFFATHAAEGVKILTGLRDAGKSYPVIGSFAFGRSFFIELQHYAKEQSDPGFYSDGVYFISPFMPDIGGVATYEFRKQFYRSYGVEPGELSACYYDAMHVATEAIKKNIIHESGQIREDRRKVRDTLASFYNEANAVKGITGSLWFDENGGVKRHFIVGVWHEHKPLPAFSQYLQHTGNIDNMIQAVLDGGVILADDIVMSHIRVVYVGMDIVGVSAIDTKQSEFTADFELRFYYPGNFDDNAIEFGNAVTPVVLGNPVKEETEDGFTIRTYRVKARFRADFAFRSFPFDGQQKLPIRFRHANQTDDRLIYVPDRLSKVLGYTASGWNLPEVLFYQDIMLKKTSLGNPEYFSSEHTLGYSRFNAAIQIKRDASAIFIVLKFIPVILMLLSLYLIVYIPPERLRSRLRIIMITLSINTAFYLWQSADLPVGHLTAIDYAYLFVYILINLSVLMSAFIYRLQREGNQKQLNIFIRTGQFFYPCVILSIIVLFVYGYVNLTG